MPKDTEMVFSVNSKNQLLGFATQVATADKPILMTTIAHPYLTSGQSKIN